ncbi:hypothetical protein M426DRAFT_14212 [Hypoxylon sp. CI-4A]|nr:hypothetical protein M426DRAFT_14212 [Hypoxylon sp. CI-4A]
MSFNRIAVYGHRGWAGSAIVKSLISTGAPLKVLYRPGSDVSNLPSNVAEAEVDVTNQEQLISALQDVDIVLSLVGRAGVPSQSEIVKAIPKTNVKLFVPSELGFRAFDEQGLRVPALKDKREVEEVAKELGVPVSVVLLGNFAESGLASPISGVDYPGNRIVFTGDSAKQPLTFCTRNYVAAAYASIFARTPPAQLAGRSIGISEFKATGDEIATALKKKHGVEPQIIRHSLEKVNNEVETCIENGVPLSLPWYCRKGWATGDLAKGIGEDIWEVEGYKKASLEELLVDGKLEAYHELPPQVKQLFDSMF